MTSTSRFWLPLLLLTLSAPLSAAAQQLDPCGGSGLTVTLTGIDGEDPPAGKVEFSEAQCSGDAVLTFDVDGFAGVKSLYIASGTASDCDQFIRRDGNTDDADCQELQLFDIDGRSEIPIELRLDTDLQCSTSTTEDIWFLAMDTWAEDPASFGACLTLPFDNTPPEPPDGLSNRSGGDSIPLSWNSTATASRYHVVWAPTTVDDSGNCEGDAPFEAAMSYTVAELEGFGNYDSTGKTTLSLSQSDVGTDGAWVAVAAADEAGNVSALSKVVCAHFVDAYSFPERFEQLGGEFKDGCSALPGRRGGSAWVLLLGGLLALSVRRRRA